MSNSASIAGREAASLFQALSDEKRLRILGLLTRGEHCVCELTAALGLPQSLLSFHLRALKDAGLVVDRRAGRWVHYSLRPEAIDDARRALDDLALEPAASAPRVTAVRC